MKKILLFLSFFAFTLSATAQSLTYEQMYRASLKKDANGNFVQQVVTPNGALISVDLSRYTMQQLQAMQYKKQPDGTYALVSSGGSGGGGTFTALSGDVTSTSTGGTTTINNGVIANAKLATDAVTSAKILDGTITRSDISPAFDALLTGYTTSLTNTYSLFGTAYDATNLGTFTGNLISDNVTVKQALQQVETAQEATAVTVGTKQDKVQYKQAGANVSTSGTITKVNVIGGTAVVNGSDATQLDITIPSNAIMQYSAGNNVNVTADGLGVTATKSSGQWVVTVPVGVKLINASVNILTTDIQTSADGSGATNWVTVNFTGVQSGATTGTFRLPTIETQVIPLGTVSVTNTVPINTTGQSFIALSAGSLTARKINMANSNDHVLSFSNF